jgi:N utilization substance protein A
LVPEDQLSLAIGRRGQNVRLASKLVGWDIEIMTRDELNEQLDKSVEAFSRIPGAPDELAENLVAQGFFSFDDLSVIEPDQLMELSGLELEQCEPMIAFAEREAERLEAEAAFRKSQDRIAAAERGALDSLGKGKSTGVVPADVAAADTASADTASVEASSEGTEAAEAAVSEGAPATEEAVETVEADATVADASAPAEAAAEETSTAE